MLNQPTINVMIRYWLRRHTHYLRTGNATMQQLTRKLAEYWQERRSVAEYAVVPNTGRCTPGGLQICEYTKSVYLSELLAEQITNILDEIKRSGEYRRLAARANNTGGDAIVLGYVKVDYLPYKG